MVDAECSVSFTAGGHGCLRGHTGPQILPYGTTTTPVEAVADFGYVFDCWSDARTSNPRTDTNVTADLDLTALFRPARTVPPNGDFLARVTAADGAARQLWNLTGSYAATVAGDPLVLSMVHEPTGRLTGTATYTIAKASAVIMPIKGNVRGTSGSVTLKGALNGTDAAGTVAVSLTLNLTVAAANLRLAGRATGTIKARGTSTRVNEYLLLPVQAPMDGTWTLRFQLGQTGREITGTALLTLSSGSGHAFVVQGRADGANAVLSLAGDPVDPACRALVIRATITPLEGGWALLQSVSARGSGQTLGWQPAVAP